MIKKIPLPITGVMLGLAALGNLLQSYSEGLRLLCGAASAILGLLFFLKLLCYPALIKEDMKNPIMASVSATFPMALMLLSVYLKPFAGVAAICLWYFGLALHATLILYFTYRFMRKLDLTKVFASYFIVYVGIAVAGITAPAYGMQAIGSAAFWFAFAALLCLLALVGYRYVKYPQIPDPAKPLFCIFAAPTSLCLAAYIQSVEVKSVAMVLGMLLLSGAIYLLVLTKLPALLKLPFYPSYAAFTFPFVITAIAAKMSMAFLGKAQVSVPFLSTVVTLETAIAAVLVLYTLVRYLQFLASAPAAAKK